MLFSPREKDEEQMRAGQERKMGGRGFRTFETQAGILEGN